MRYVIPLLTILLAACQTAPGDVHPRMPQMVVPTDSSDPAQPRDGTLQQGIEVGEIALEGAAAGQIGGVGAISRDDLREALINTLASRGLLAASRPVHRLDMRITDATTPTIPGPFETRITITATYVLRNAQTGTEVWRANEATVAERKITSGLPEPVLMERDALEEAIRENIARMLGLLYQREGALAPL
ncbi:LPS assembly lipoprotein LptE [Skermanella stibiiresistens]|nr:LPS assembly lipoprotein LptE [Skermanella stibiiresistens]